jgi:drug/metabolite transporter (DMT)-like permease
MNCSWFRDSSSRARSSGAHFFGSTLALGIGIKLISTLSLTSMSALIRSLGDTVPLGQIVFSRNLFALVPILVWMGMRGDLGAAVRTRRISGHLLRSFIGVSSMFCTFWALGRLALPDAVTINYAQPLIVVVLAALILHERVRIYRWSAVIVGLVGVVVILWPHLAGGQLAEMLTGAGDAPLTAQAAVAAFFGAVFSAGAMIQVRRLIDTETTASVVFYFSATAALAGLATLPLGWVVPDLGSAVVLVCIGLLGGIGQIFLTACYRYADASLVASFEYSSMLWALAIGYLAFGDLPTVYTLLGGAILITAGIYVILRERRIGGDRTGPATAAAPLAR